MADLFSWGVEEATPEQGKELPTTVKSEEELAKFTVDENLSEVERTILFLNGGQITQQKHAIANLPHVIKGKARQAWEAIAGPLKSALNRLDADCQIEAAEVFAYIAKERLMSPSDLQACLLPTVVRNINKERSEEETEAWVKALFELMPMLDKEVLKSEIMSLALSKGDVEDSVGSRMLAARILGALAPFMTRDEVERGFFRRAMAMCQDVDYLVRRCMCEQLGAIGRTAGRELLLKDMLGELFEALKDEELQVRDAAFGALVSLLDMVPPDVRRAKVMPVLRDHMQPFELDIAMQRCIARNFGIMLTVVKGEMEQDDVQVFYGCFKHLASKTDAELRRACAGSFAAVVKAAAALHPNAFPAHFSDSFQSLATDFDEEVRVSIAAAIHEVARWAGKEHCGNLLTRPLTRLLRDESARVQAAVLPNINATLAFFVSGEDSRRDAHLDEIVRALLDVEAHSARNWRLQAQLATAFPGFPQVFSSDQIYDHFLPMAFRFLSNSAAAVRPLAAEGVVVFLRHNRKERQRADVFLRLIRDFARGKSYTARLAFAEAARHAVRRFSARFTKEWLFDLCLELLYDPVPNVRMQTTGVLPHLKQAIRLPEDVDLLERLNNAMSNSMSDNDRDVSAQARCVNDQYKRMPVRMVGGMGLGGDASGGAQAAYEAEDRKKEEEERELDWSFTPEEAKEIKSEIVQLNYKKRAGSGSNAVDARSAIQRRIVEAGRVGPMGTRPGLTSTGASSKPGSGGAESAGARTSGPLAPSRTAGALSSSAPLGPAATRVTSHATLGGARKSEPGVPAKPGVSATSTAAGARTAGAGPAARVPASPTSSTTPRLPSIATRTSAAAPAPAAAGRPAALSAAGKPPTAAASRVPVATLASRPGVGKK